MMRAMKKTWVYSTVRRRREMAFAIARRQCLHLPRYESAQSESLDRLESEARALREAKRFWVSVRNPEEASLVDTMSANGSREAGLLAARRLLEWSRRIEEIECRLVELESEVDYARRFGHWRAETIQKFARRDLHIKFYKAPDSVESIQGESGVVRKFWTDGREAYLIYIARRPDACLWFREIQPPQKSIEGLQFEQWRLRDELASLRRHTRDWKSAIVDLDAAIHETDIELRLERALALLEQSGDICSLVGYCPVEEVSNLRSALKREGFGVVVDEPSEADDVPTRLSQGWATTYVSPIYRMLGVTPGYREPDVSLFFLLFFILFVGMVFGDVGYGALLGIGAWALRRWSNAIGAPTFRLALACAASCVGWGILTGQYFGSGLAERIPFLGGLMAPTLSGNGLARFCLFLGALHLTIGRLVSLRRRWNEESLGEAGWIFVIWAFMDIGSALIVGGEIRVVSVAFVLFGWGLAMFFGPGAAGVAGWKQLGMGLSNFPAMAISGVGVLSDVVSYIRLFAVGLATKEVADAFNGLALTVGFNGLGVAILGATTLVLGHSVNLALAGMGVLVHGVRLNLLEFSRHVGAEWAGIPYRPFTLGANDLAGAGPRQSRSCEQ